MFRWVSCLLVWFFVVSASLPAFAQRGRIRRPALAAVPGTSRLVPPPRKAPAKPAPIVGSAPMLPRYWLLSDSAERVASAEVFGQYLSHFVQYPSTALQAGIGATIHALISVLPDGRVESISVTRRDLAIAVDSTAVKTPVNTDLATAKAVREMDAELLRVVWQLRFKPAAPPADSIAATVRADTVTISHRFAPQ